MAARAVRVEGAPSRVSARNGGRARGVLAGGGVVAGSRAQVAEIQRSRLLVGAVRAVLELGYAEATVAQITGRARVSRRTFYELFENREQCLTAVLDDAIALIQADLQTAGLEGLVWRERLRLGLWRILCFLDREPGLARACLAHLQGGPGARERHQQLLGGLAGLVDEGREGRSEQELSPLAAEGVVGAAFTIVQSRLLRDPQKPLRDLLGELTGLIVLPYLGPAAARRERSRSNPPLPEGSAETEPGLQGAFVDPLVGVRMRLTYRTARVLQGIAELPGASNRELADQAGIHDQGQVSKLLGRLERLGLVENRGEGHSKGEPNAWALTPRGEQVTRSITTRLPAKAEAR
jgi:AcrR family transcriptional regulator/DNA-binding MarR family transcriptional regulator